MWYLKLVDLSGRETIHPCDHFVVTRYLPGSAVLADFIEKFGGTEEEAAGIEVQLIERHGIDAETQELVAERDETARACDLAELGLSSLVEVRLMQDDAQKAILALFKGDAEKVQCCNPVGILSAGQLSTIEQTLTTEQRDALVAYRSTLEAFVAVHRELENKDIGTEKHTLHVPRDGSVIYAMNEYGDVVDGYRWPPRNKQTQVLREAGNAAGKSSRR